MTMDLLTGSVLFGCVNYAWIMKFKLYHQNSTSKLANLQLERTALTVKPVYGEYIGNLLKLVEEIENFILFPAYTGLLSKETVPFICVVNPPRHGKSLLLDTLFKTDAKNTVVISITYNTGSPICQEETISSVCATKYFWLRCIKAILGLRQELNQLNITYPDKLDLLSVLTITRKFFTTDPFHDVVKNRSKNILICVDEFSKLTDEMSERLQFHEMELFLNSLHAAKQLDPFVQYVFTGFNMKMTYLLNDASKAKWFSLKSCDFPSASPILTKIRKEYDRTNSKFPSLLFQCIKCSPGLVGQWAEFVSEKHKDDNLDTFRDKINWLRNISSREKLDINWQLLCDYLEYLEMYVKDRSKGSELEESLFNANLASINEEEYDTESCIKHIVPICVVLIAQYVRLPPHGHEWHKTLLQLLLQIFDTINSFDLDNKEGHPYEMYGLLCMRVRLLLRNKSESEYVQLRFGDLFPGTHYSYCENKPWCVQHIVISRIATKKECRKFLLNPFYYLFPVSWRMLQKSAQYEYEGGIARWIETKSDLILPADNDTTQHDCFMINKVFWQKRDQKNTYTPITLVHKKEEKHSIIDDTFAVLFKEFIMNFPQEEIVDKQNLDFLADAFILSCPQYGENQKVVRSWWNSTVGNIKKLFESFKLGSFAMTPKNMEGADIVVSWKEEASIPDSCASEEEEFSSTAVQTIYHIAAVEVKDRRYTEKSELDEKFESLKSPRNCVWWINCLPQYRSTIVKFHVIFVGRED